MHNLLFLLDNVSTVVGGGADAAAPAADAAAAAGAGAASAAGAAPNPVMLIVLYCAVIFGALYFFSIRPQKKREKQLAEMRSEIQVGDSVLLNNGMYGKVVDSSVECFIIEFGTNKGIRIPVVKQEVLAKREPNLSNKEEVVEEAPKEEKKGFFGLGKSKDGDTDK